VSGLPFREQPRLERDIRIGNDVWLGAGVVVTAGVTVGDGCIVGAGAVVTRDLPADCIAAGVPARVVGQRQEAGQIARV
jgi:acetyltransferase-like isoleucine patch superfamily enzyme